MSDIWERRLADLTQQLRECEEARHNAVREARGLRKRVAELQSRVRFCEQHANVTFGGCPTCVAIERHDALVEAEERIAEVQAERNGAREILDRHLPVLEGRIAELERSRGIQRRAQEGSNT